MCHALVFNIHHVVTHSTRVPLFLPPRSKPIQVDPMVGDPPMSSIRWCRSRPYFLRMWGGREVMWALKPSLGFPKREDHWEGGPHKVKRIRANGWVRVQGAGWARGEGRVEAHGKKAMQETCYCLCATTRVGYKQWINFIILVLASIMKLRFFEIKLLPPNLPKQKESLVKYQTQNLHRREEEVRPYLDKPNKGSRGSSKMCSTFSFFLSHVTMFVDYLGFVFTQVHSMVS